MFKSLEGNFDNPKVHELLSKHFVELRSASPEGSAHVLDIPGLKVSSIKFWSLWQNENLIGCGALKFLNVQLFHSSLNFIYTIYLQLRMNFIKYFFCRQST